MTARSVNLSDDSLTAKKAPEGGNPDKKAIRVASILSNAADLFQVSYEKTSMRDVGRRVGLDAATIYHYFPSKESILLAILAEGAAASLGLIRDAASTIGKPADRLRAAVRSHIEFAVSSPTLDLQARYFHIFSEQDQAHLAFARDMFDSLFEQLLVDVATSRGANIDEPAVLRNFCFGAFNDVRRWYRPSGHLSLEQIADSYADFIERAIGPSYVD